MFKEPGDPINIPRHILQYDDLYCADSSGAENVRKLAPLKGQLLDTRDEFSPTNVIAMNMLDKLPAPPLLNSSVMTRYRSIFRMWPTVEGKLFHFPGYCEDIRKVTT
jgi:hypothetical protein